MTATVKFFRLFLLAAVIGAASTAWAADPLRLRSPRRILFAYVRSRAEESPAFAAKSARTRYTTRNQKGLRIAPQALLILDVVGYARDLSLVCRFLTNSFSTSLALLLITLSPNMASLPTMFTSIL